MASIPVVRSPDDVHPAERGKGAALVEEHDAGPDDVPDVRAVPEPEGVAAARLATAGGNCIKIGLPGKLILSKRKGLREVLFS